MASPVKIGDWFIELNTSSKAALVSYFLLPASRMEVLGSWRHSRQILTFTYLDVTVLRSLSIPPRCNLKGCDFPSCVIKTVNWVQFNRRGALLARFKLTHFSSPRERAPTTTTKTSMPQRQTKFDVMNMLIITQYGLHWRDMKPLWSFPGFLVHEVSRCVDIPLANRVYKCLSSLPPLLKMENCKAGKAMFNYFSIYAPLIYIVGPLIIQFITF